MTAFPIVKEGWPFIGIMICVTALVAAVVNVYWVYYPPLYVVFSLIFSATLPERWTTILFICFRQLMEKS